MAKKRYTSAPEVPAEQVQRLRAILEVLAGAQTVSGAARSLGMSRNHFQSLLHRGLSAMVDSITPKAGGRPAKAAEVIQLQAQLEQLRRQNARLRDRAGTTERLLQAASGLLQGRIRPARQPRTRKATKGVDEENEAEPRRRKLEEIDALRAMGLNQAQAASVAGVHASTVRRWRGARPEQARRRARIAPQAAREVSDLVRSLRGQVGAESIRRSVAGVSRRQAARLKAITLTDMERARKAQLRQVRVTSPGLVRGLDGMYFRCREGRAHALIAADAAIPYRTSVVVATRYDVRLVCRALVEDITRNGAPLVYRLDRASCHDTAEVRELLGFHRILLLQGPPRCPRFYGQLERQNREHRAWQDEIAELRLGDLEVCLEEMLAAVNRLWRRRTLAWRTAYELWGERPAIEVDRDALTNEVEERAARIGRSLQCRGKPADLARRLAIEQALETRGYLRQTAGGWC